jgi:hypothetical protein
VLHLAARARRAQNRVTAMIPEPTTTTHASPVPDAHEPGLFDDVLKHVVWGFALEAAAECETDVGFVETHCGPPEYGVPLDVRRAHFLAPVPSEDGSPSAHYARVLRSCIRVRGTFVQVPGSSALTLSVVGARVRSPFDTFALLSDVRERVFDELAAHPVYARAFHRTRCFVEDGFGDFATSTLDARVQGLARNCSNRLLVALVDAREYRESPRFDAGASARGVLFGERLHAWTMQFLEASAEPPNAVIVVAVPGAAGDLVDALHHSFRYAMVRSTGALATLEAPGEPLHHVGLIGTGPHGSQVVARACLAPWEHSPTLAALGCRVRVDVR